ncbi:hypothetical protein [Chitinophaga sp.]|uniref:hypothetical protein n=1 Tax=Chitinophaga sp. TaxID=1869181 RepID=UPI0031D637D9
MRFLKIIDKIDHGRSAIIAPIVIIVLLGALCSYLGAPYRNRLYNNKVFTTCEIYDYGIIARSVGTSFSCRFYVDGEKYVFSEDVREIAMRNADVFLGKSFPVVYEKGNPSNFRMLMLPEDFQKFDMPYPDSLNWVRKYF